MAQGNWQQGKGVMNRCYSESHSEEACWVLSGWADDGRNFCPIRLLWKSNAEAVALMLIILASIFPTVAAAFANIGVWRQMPSEEAKNMIAVTQGLVACCEHFIAAVALGAFDETLFVCLSERFQSSEFIQFKKILHECVEKENADARGAAVAAMSDASQSVIGAAIKPVVESFNRVLDLIPTDRKLSTRTPPNSESSTEHASLENPIPYLGSQTDLLLHPLGGLPPRASWKQQAGTPPPDFALNFDFFSAIKATTTVKTLETLYKSTLRPLEDMYGEGGAGFRERGETWRGHKYRGSSGSNNWSKYMPLFTLFSAGVTESEIGVLQERINT